MHIERSDQSLVTRIMGVDKQVTRDEERVLRDVEQR